MLFGGEGQEATHRGHFARRRGWAKPIIAAVGEERTKVGGVKVEQPEAADLLAPIALEKFDQPVGGGDIGSDRVRRATPIEGEKPAPALGQLPRRMGGRLIAQSVVRVSHPRMIAPSDWPRNSNSAAP